MPDIRFCRGWKEILELRVREERNTKDIFLFKVITSKKSAALFDCMWKLIAEPNLIQNQASISGGKEQAQDPNVPKRRNYSLLERQQMEHISYSIFVISVDCIMESKSYKLC